MQRGRTLSANFANQGLTNAQFDLTNFTYTTDADDSNRPCIAMTDWLSQASIIAKSGFMFGDVDCHMRFKIPTGGAHGSVSLQLCGRYIDSNNSVFATYFSPSNAAQVIERSAGSNSQVRSTTVSALSAGYDVTIDGAVRRAAVINRTAEDAANPGIVLNLYARDGQHGTPRFPATIPEWARYVEITITHKMENIAHSGAHTFLGAAVSMYYNDIKSGGLNTIGGGGGGAQTDYYAGWGPSGTVGGTGASGGLGSTGGSARAGLYRCTHTTAPTSSSPLSCCTTPMLRAHGQ
jgi:hypothetical protein